MTSMALWANPDQPRYRLVDRLGPTAREVEARFVIQKRWWRWWFTHVDLRVLYLHDLQDKLGWSAFCNSEEAISATAKLAFEAYLKRVNYRTTVLDSR